MVQKWFREASEAPIRIYRELQVARTLRRIDLRLVRSPRNRIDCKTQSILNDEQNNAKVAREASGRPIGPGREKREEEREKRENVRKIAITKKQTPKHIPNKFSVLPRQALRCRKGSASQNPCTGSMEPDSSRGARRRRKRHRRTFQKVSEKKIRRR